MQRLPPTSRALIEGAAVAGEPFDPDLAAAAAGLQPDVGLIALDALVAADLVRDAGTPRMFVFRHPLVRRAVYDAAQRGGGWRRMSASPSRCSAAARSRWRAPITSSRALVPATRRR